RTVADQQGARWSMQVTKVIGQSFSPGRCSVLTPMIAGFRCGRQNGAYDGFSSFR
ncbi:MAG: hypothetical protein HY985_00265, partial [Magnetospirillum sp.]|nr:hypothetical protein [Magnetospirillum sp.]